MLTVNSWVRLVVIRQLWNGETWKMPVKLVGHVKSIYYLSGVVDSLELIRMVWWYVIEYCVMWIEWWFEMTAMCLECWKRVLIWCHTTSRDPWRNQINSYCWMDQLWDSCFDLYLCCDHLPIIQSTCVILVMIIPLMDSCEVRGSSDYHIWGYNWL